MPGMPNTPTAIPAMWTSNPCSSRGCWWETSPEGPPITADPHPRTAGTRSSSTAAWTTSGTPPSLWCLISRRSTPSTCCSTRRRARTHTSILSLHGQLRGQLQFQFQFQHHSQFQHRDQFKHRDQSCDPAYQFTKPLRTLPHQFNQFIEPQQSQRKSLIPVSFVKDEVSKSLCK